MDIKFHCSSGGRYYVEDSIFDQPPKTVKKIRRDLGLLQKYGLNFMTKSGNMKKLQGYDMYEIIIDFNKICYRIFCVIRQTTCWLLHMFIKKTPNTPLKEIKTALQRVVNLDLKLGFTVN